MTDLAAAMTSIADAFEQLAAVLRAASNEAAKSDTPPPVPWSKPGHWCTPERKELLRTDYPAGVAPDAIRTRLADCDGPAVPSWDNIGTYCANVLKIHRPAKPPAKPLVVDVTSLRERAAIWGLNDIFRPAEEILVLMNEKAARMGHPAFQLQQRNTR